MVISKFLEEGWTLNAFNCDAFFFLESRRISEPNYCKYIWTNDVKHCEIFNIPVSMNLRWLAGSTHDIFASILIFRPSAVIPDIYDWNWLYPSLFALPYRRGRSLSLSLSGCCYNGFDSVWTCLKLIAGDWMVVWYGLDDCAVIACMWGWLVCECVFLMMWPKFWIICLVYKAYIICSYFLSDSVHVSHSFAVMCSQTSCLVLRHFVKGS